MKRGRKKKDETTDTFQRKKKEGGRRWPREKTHAIIPSYGPGGNWGKIPVKRDGKKKTGGKRER